MPPTRAEPVRDEITRLSADGGRKVSQGRVSRQQEDEGKEKCVWRGGGGRRRGGGQPACLDDPTELPYARQMPRLVSSGHGHWHIKKNGVWLFLLGRGEGLGATAGRLAVITEEPHGEAGSSEYLGTI